MQEDRTNGYISARCLRYARKARLKMEESRMLRIRDKSMVEKESTSMKRDGVQSLNKGDRS